MTREREEITKEEAIKRLKEAKSTIQPYLYVDKAIDYAVEFMEQESALDKIEEEIKDTLYVDSLIFTELIDFKNGKISADDVIEEFNRVTRMEVLRIIDKYRTESEGKE